MPRVKQAIIESGDVQPAPPEFSEAEFDRSDIQIVQMDRLAHKAAEEKFMNEMIEIEIEPGTEPNDPMYVYLGHEGKSQMVLRGAVQPVKRKYLYVALMAKKVSMNCVFERGPNHTDINKLTPAVSTTYRARLISDNNPQGGSKWVQDVMRQATGMHVH